MEAGQPFKAAVVQAGSVVFDREQSVNKAVKLIREAGENGANIILFPEAFLSAYPRGMSFGTKIGSRNEEGRTDFRRYADSSVFVPGPETDRIGKAAKEAGAYVVMGIIEKDRNQSGGTLYCTVIFIDPDGQVIGKHRKLKPTGTERLVWGEGDGSTLPVFDTPYGRIGALICWENYMPLARMAMYQKGVQIYLAPTADSRDTWFATMRHIACEGRCFVLSCNQYSTKDMYPPDIAERELGDFGHEVTRGGSCIVDPLGEFIVEPVMGKEEILYAELDLSKITEAKFDFDVVGHYARPDVFKFEVNEKPMGNG
ncbi:carbon-nitrogen hydrolase family protein [Edaphobacillus lindanitolerans]|uniref:Nitrilase n=1 Tax=Edaphobacillus lindanitolerans TaxID=550447 RepID=A0A1U7PNB3_9BACI|nr:carbon-nitrogen hydrolase family protein [Edaphobacillus lindanitolerans]SIT72546.1 nitrilase [Edaphobacillus lindanitolerans]